MRRKSAWCLVGVIVTVATLTALRLRGPDAGVDVYIGNAPAGHSLLKEDGFTFMTRLALRRLAVELERHPKSDVFTIRYGEPWSYSDYFLDQHPYQWGQTCLVYVRHRRRLTVMESDASFGEYASVTDASIKAVVAAHGAVEDLTHFGCQDISV